MFLELLEIDVDNAKHVISKETILCIIKVSKYFDLSFVNKSIKKVFYTFFRIILQALSNHVKIKKKK